MGRTLSVHVGFGVVLPWGEDNEFDFASNSFYGGFYETDEDEREEWDTPDTYEVLSHIVQTYPALEEDTAYFSDYRGDSVLFIKSTVARTWDADVLPFRPMDVVILPDDLDQLREAAELLGVPYEPSWLAVASYG